MRGVSRLVVVAGMAYLPAVSVLAGPMPKLEPMDVFELELASDPQISPDGRRVAYVRASMDVMHNQRRTRLWLVDVATGEQRPVAAEAGAVASPRWSPRGDRLAWIGGEADATQIWVRWMETGDTAPVTHLTETPGNLAWSPDGATLAFTMRVPEKAEPMARIPEPPEGADWGPPPRVVERMSYRADGVGWLPRGFVHVFVVPASGGTPRRLTTGPFHHRGRLAWTPDASSIVLSANRREDADYEPLDSELFRVRVEDGTLDALTDRRGPDQEPAVSPDGAWVAWTGFDDRYQGYQRDRLYLMRSDGSGRRELLPDLDRSVSGLIWSGDSRHVYFQYDDRGRTRIARVSLDGAMEDVAEDLGGLSLGRPYPGGSFSLSPDGLVAFTRVGPHRPADVAVVEAGRMRRLTGLNEDLLGRRALGEVEELRAESGVDGREIQAWCVRPPDFDPSREYPLLLEIHGGPFANYGPRFGVEMQLYAAAGYVVVYANPRGSTSYGEEFGNLIHHAYPGQDYDDLMAVVDAAVARGSIDPERLFVTGGSGGGVLSAWIVGKTSRFRAAVVQKPVINWTSFVLHADGIGFFSRYWFPAPSWEDPEAYRTRSPLSLVGNVETPTMLVTGEEDWRTPMSETEQYYAALKLRRVPTAMVRIPGASHGIANRPAHLIAKVAHVLAWFERWGSAAGD